MQQHRVVVPAVYREAVLPKRCRNWRDANFKMRVELSLRGISVEQAPEAFVVWEMDGTARVKRLPDVYRWFGGELWTPLLLKVVGRPDEAVTLESLAARAKRGDTYCNPFAIDVGALALRDHQRLPEMVEADYRDVERNGPAAVEQQVREIERRVLVIDGMVYVPTGEPRYVVMTFGLGNNHGLGRGTELSVTSYYNSNIGAKRYFRADQFEAAVESTRKVALARGDTKAVPVEPFETIEVLIAEAVRCQPNVEHGQGDPFLNSIEAGIRAAGPVGGMLAAVKGITSSL